MRPVIICTEHRGVFYGRTAEATEDILKSKVVKLSDARAAIYFGTTKGVLQLAETGPTDSTKHSSKADIGINAVTSVFEVSEQAAKVWDALA